MKNFWCKIGLHEWYYGSFAFPVYGRYERHCLNCDKKQFKKYENKKRFWITIT